jgi:prophage tail gpP-like protein
VRRSTADRYSRVICVGSSIGTTVSYGKNVTARYAEAKNNPATAEGDGLDFSAPKRLIIMRSPSSQAEARELAEREMARRDAHGAGITAVCAGHGQVISGSSTPTIFAPDTLASVEDERTGMQGIFLIVACTYRSNRIDGETTTMELVKSGSDLSPT